MAILRSTSGKFYEIPDSELNQYQVSEELVAQIRGGGPEGPEGGPGGEPGMGPEGGPEGGPAGGPGGGGVDPYGFHIHLGGFGHRRRRWRNYWRNCWRNCY